MSEYIALGLPDDINVALERDCQKTGIPKSMLILEKLRQVYGIPKPDSAHLQTRIAQLESQILVLMQQVRLLQDPRLNTPDGDRPWHSEPVSSDPISPPSHPPLPDDDEWADEPDEVLYDFLEPGQELPY